MPTIRVERPHTLSHEEARAVAEKLARRYEKQLGVRSQWQEEVLHFERKGASGRITVEEDKVRVVLELGTMMGLMKEQIQQAVEDHLDEHLA